MAVLRGAKVFKLYDPTQSTLLYAGTPLIEARFEAERRSGKFVIKDRSASAISSRYEKPIRLSPYSPLNIEKGVDLHAPAFHDLQLLCQRTVEPRLVIYYSFRLVGGTR
jgi:hypothetical protein